MGLRRGRKEKGKATKNGEEKNVKCGKVPREKPWILYPRTTESLVDDGQGPWRLHRYKLLDLLRQLELVLLL
jgi:hypothetical protein